MWTWMVRVDSKQEINDWCAIHSATAPGYSVIGVQPDLFDDVVLARFWSGRDIRKQRAQFEPFDDESAARAAADRLIQEKLGEGYCIVAGYAPEAERTELGIGD